MVDFVERITKGDNIDMAIYCQDLVKLFNGFLEYFCFCLSLASASCKATMILALAEARLDRTALSLISEAYGLWG